MAAWKVWGALGLRRDGPPVAAEHDKVRVNVRCEVQRCKVSSLPSRPACNKVASSRRCAHDAQGKPPRAAHRAASRRLANRVDLLESHDVAFPHRRGYLMVLLPPWRQGGAGATPQKHLAHAQHQHWVAAVARFPTASSHGRLQGQFLRLSKATKEASCGHRIGR